MTHRRKSVEVTPDYRTKGLLLQAIRLAVSKRQQARAKVKLVPKSSGVA